MIELENFCVVHLILPSAISKCSFGLVMVTMNLLPLTCWVSCILGVVSHRNFFSNSLLSAS